MIRLTLFSNGKSESSKRGEGRLGGNSRKRQGNSIVADPIQIHHSPPLFASLMKQLALAITSLATVALNHGGSVNALVVGPSGQNLSYRYRPSIAVRRDVKRQLPQVAYKTARFSSVPSDGDTSSTASTSKASTLASTTEVQIPLSLTLATGIITTLLGFVYSKCMKSGFKLLWKTIPSYLLDSTSKNYVSKFIQAYPAMYIVLMTSCGGAAVAYI
jgi:hypothetical protein